MGWFAEGRLLGKESLKADVTGAVAKGLARDVQHYTSSTGSRRGARTGPHLPSRARRRTVGYDGASWKVGAVDTAIGMGKRPQRWSTCGLRLPMAARESRLVCWRAPHSSTAQDRSHGHSSEPNHCRPSGKYRRPSAQEPRSAQQRRLAATTHATGFQDRKGERDCDRIFSGLRASAETPWSLASAIRHKAAFGITRLARECLDGGRKLPSGYRLAW